MIRNVAREIAVHLSYELSFSELGVSELLDQRLSEEGFAALAEEDELYCQTPWYCQLNSNGSGTWNIFY